VRPPQNAPAESSRATRVKGVYPLWCIGRSVTALSVPDMDAADRVGGRVGGGLRTFTIDTVGLSTAVSRAG